MDITELLAFSINNAASDLHISAGLPPLMRVDGILRNINLPPLDQGTAQDLIYIVGQEIQTTKMDN
jgi:twitching motility protein PilT